MDMFLSIKVLPSIYIILCPTPSCKMHKLSAKIVLIVVWLDLICFLTSFEFVLTTMHTLEFVMSQCIFDRTKNP